MRKDINEETKKRLIPIYEQVEKDLVIFLLSKQQKIYLFGGIKLRI